VLVSTRNELKMSTNHVLDTPNHLQSRALLLALVLVLAPLLTAEPYRAVPISLLTRVQYVHA
jgi:hypothetical protein